MESSVETPTNPTGEVEQVISRLQQEKKATNDNYYTMGRLVAKKFIKNAPYKDVSYAIRKFAGTSEIGEVEVRLVSTDLILGKYFKNLLDKDPYLATDVDTHNEFAESYLKGWVELVVSFWNEIKGKI
jgi:hypothetical protein